MLNSIREIFDIAGISFESMLFIEAKFNDQNSILMPLIIKDCALQLLEPSLIFQQVQLIVCMLWLLLVSRLKLFNKDLQSSKNISFNARTVTEMIRICQENFIVDIVILDENGGGVLLK